MDREQTLFHYIKFYTCRTDEDSKLVVETFVKIYIYDLITPGLD